MSLCSVLKRAALIGVFFQGVAAAQPAPVAHDVSFPQVNSQYVRVRSEFPAGAENRELAMPVWTPGSYKVRDFAAHVEQMQASDGAGKPVSFRKVAKNRWRFAVPAGQRLVVSYDVWAGRQNVSENWVESGFAVLNGAGLFLYADDTLNVAQRLTIEPAPGWPRVAVALEKGAGAFEYHAASYHELVDSPIVLGETQEAAFSSAGQDYRLVLAEPNTLWDMPLAIRHLEALVDTQQAFWGVNPLQREYLFLVAFIGGYSGLEHDHSTLMMDKRWAMRNTQDYVKWLELVSHEFFHVWNVRRLRPATFWQYDYDAENYSRELWLAEGLSSYYDHMLLFRSGLIDVSDYLRLLAAEVRNYEVTPGRRVRSAESASFDAWMKQYEPDPNRVNSTVSYYRKGALIGLIADIEIRRATDGDYSLDDVMRTLYRRHGPEGSVARGYTREDFEKIVVELAGEGVIREVKPLYASTADPQVDDALGWLGLRVVRGNGSDDEPPGLGVTWNDDSERLLVQSVLLEHSAAAAGIVPGDEILAIDGLRVSVGNIRRMLRLFQPGDTVDVLLSRNGRVLTLPVLLEQRIPETYSIVPRDNLGRRQKQRMEDWLGRPLRFND
jgi:predicted metalloprotease with PDZ domain